jgi:hypothetical protein
MWGMGGEENGRRGEWGEGQTWNAAMASTPSAPIEIPPYQIQPLISNVLYGLPTFRRLVQDLSAIHLSRS